MTTDDPSKVQTRPPIRATPRATVSFLREIQRLARASGALDPALVSQWPEIVGPELAAVCRPVRIARQKNAETLVVAAPSGAAAMKVQFAQTEILARARTALGRGRLTRLPIEQSGGQAAARAAPMGPRQDTVQKPSAKRGRWRSATLAPPPPPVLPPAGSVEEALERLKEALERGPDRDG